MGLGKSKVITTAKIGIEDMQGDATATGNALLRPIMQNRNGVKVAITPIQADNLPYDASTSIKDAIDNAHTRIGSVSPDTIQWDEEHTLRQEIAEGFAGKATKEEVAEARIRNWEAGVGYKRNDTVYYESSNLTGVFFWNSDIVALNVSPETNQGWVRIGSDETDLSGHATTQALETETTEREQADSALGVRDTAIELKADQAIASASALAQKFMDLPEFPTDAQMVEAARLAREANALQGSTNATDIITERTARQLADTNLGTRITSEINNRIAGVNEAYRRITALGTISTPAEITQSANNAITTSIASGAIKLALDEIVVSGGGLQLEAFKAGSFEKLCTVNGEETGTGSVSLASLTLVCSGNTPTSGIAELRGTIRFTVNASWNGGLVLSDGLKQTLITATQISGGDTGEQEWRVEGVEWDLSDERTKRIEIETHDFTPSQQGALAFTFSGELIGQSLDGEAVDAIRILVEEAQTPDLFQTVSDNIPFNHPFKESPSTRDVPAVETFTFSSDFEGIGVGKVVKIDSYFDFDLNPSNGSLPRCELTIMQAGRILSYTDYMDAQTANPISYKAVAGGGAITFIGKATSTNELTQLLHMYTSDQTVYIEGKYSAIFNQLMDAGIALATASLKSRLTNLENLPVQDITALQNSYDTLLAQVNNPVLQALSHGTVSNESRYIVARSPLGDKWQAVLEFTSSPYRRRVLTNSANIGATLTAGSQQAIIGRFKDGAFYGQSAQHTIITPARTDTVDNAFTPLPVEGIALGVQNQHSQSSHSLPPVLQIPTGAVIQARLALHIAGSNDPAEFNLLSGENNVFTNSGETLTVFFDVVDGVPRIRIVESGSNSLPLDNGVLTGFIRYTNEVAQTTETIPASETLLFEGHAPIIIEAENPTASTASNLTIIYGNNQRFDTHTSGAYQDFYVEQNEATKEIFHIVDSESYDLTELDITQYRMGLWTRTPHQSQKVGIPTGFEITHTDGEVIDLGAEIIALRAKEGGSGGGVAKGEFGDFLETTYPSFEVDLTNFAGTVSANVPHELTHDCEVRGARIEVLEALTFTGDALGVSPVIDQSVFRASSFALSKVGDSVVYYANTGGKFIDHSSDIQIYSVNNFGNSSGSASGRVRLVLICQRMTK